jgi:hypothetical protein
MTTRTRRTEPLTVMGRTDKPNGEWFATVEVAGKKYTVWHQRGRAVRIAYKPRGENRGYRWHGSVRDMETSKTLWSGEVAKSTGIRWMLECAGVVALRPSELRKQIRSVEFSLHCKTNELANIGMYGLTPMLREQRKAERQREIDALENKLAELKAKLGD